jgi:hypothetical protein
MPENASHAPGKEISGEGGAIRQRQKMGRGEGPMSGEGEFGVGSLPGSRISGNMAGSMAHDGMHLGDHERSNPPNMAQGKGMMHATAHSDHGPHNHHEPAMETTQERHAAHKAGRHGHGSK